MSLPAWSSKLLGWIVPGDRRDDVLGDLWEIHQRRRRAGELAAWLATSLETCLLAAAFVLYRLRQSEWTAPGWSGLDLRLGWRLLRKQPLLAATSILAMAIGIGVATTGFTVFNAVIHAELPFPDGERFVRVIAHEMPSGWHRPLDAEHLHLLRRLDAFEHVGATDRVELNLLDPTGGVESVIGAWITPSSFDQLPAVPLLGRPLQASDGEIGAPPVVVLRESLWIRRYGGRSEVLGQPLNVAGTLYSIVGVLPDSVGFPTGGELWLPLDERRFGGTPEHPRDGLAYFAVLRPGATQERAADEVAAASARYFEAHPRAETIRIRVADYLEAHPQERLTASMMVGALILLLVVITANVANLIVARTASRTSELAVRSALGAGRSRLVAQLAVEVAVLGAIAAGLGLLASQIALGWLEPRLTERPFWLDLGVNARVVGFVVASALIASGVGGVLPAIRATRRDTAPALKANHDHGGDLRLGRAGSVMMVVEMAVSVVLLSGAIGIASGLVGTLSVDSVELPTGQLLTASVRQPRAEPGVAGSVAAAPEDEAPAVATRITQAIAALPGVEAAGLGSRLPRQSGPRVPILVEGSSETDRPSARRAAVVRARPGFLEALGARRVAGRLLQPTDVADGAPPVVVVNEHFVDRYLGGRPAVGQRFQILDAAADSTTAPVWHTIVGVVPDLGLDGGGAEAGAGFYLPWGDDPRFFDLVVRTTGDPTALADPLRRRIASIDPHIHVSDIVPLEAVDADSRALIAAFANSLVLVGGVVMLLSAVCLYAMTAFAVTRRTREIGIRVALGATRVDILRMIASGAGRSLLLGAAIGSLVAFAAAAAGVHERLFDLPLASPNPWALPAVVALLSIAGVIACWLPARRALAIRPIEALHFD